MLRGAPSKWGEQLWACCQPPAFPWVCSPSLCCSWPIWCWRLWDGDDDFWRAWAVMAALNPPARVSVTTGYAGGKGFLACFFHHWLFVWSEKLRLGEKVIISCFSSSEIAPHACFNAVSYNLEVVLENFLWPNSWLAFSSFPYCSF